MESTEGIYAAMAGMMMFSSIIGIIMLIIYWVIFTKAGQPGWAGIIPFYNLYILTKIIGKPGIWVLWMILPIVNVIFLIWTFNLLSKSFGKGVGFTLGLIFLFPIFGAILAFGSAKYVGPAGAN